LGMFLGVAVMVLAGFLLVNYFRSINQPAGQTSSTATEIEGAAELTDKSTGQPDDQFGEPTIQPRPGNEYVIERGDSLWKISVKTYGTGYAWSRIYEANQDVIGDNASLLTEGTRINLPDQQPLEHTVVAGDNLWNVASTYCGTGTLWEAIAVANYIPNPRLIKPGLVLRISCK